MGIVLPDTIQDPVTDDFITTAWGDGVNAVAAYLGRDLPHARVYNSGAISISNSSLTALTFDSERVDVGSCHSTGSNPSRLTAPDAGYYSSAGNVSWAANATGVRQASIRLNGATIIGEVILPNVGAGTAAEIQVVASYQLAAGDYLELCVLQNSGGSLNVNAGASISPEFWFQWVCS